MIRRWFGKHRTPIPPGTLFTCLRNEAPFLIEWIAYHKALGFDRIIIGANDCTDRSNDMLARLAQMGEIVYLPFYHTKADVGPQYQFAQMLHDADLIAVNDWICWLDLDEFLVIHLGDGRLSALLDRIKHANGIQIHWRYFGIPPQTAWPGRQLHPDLCRCADVGFQLGGRRMDHRTFKSLYRYEDGMAFHIHGPILAPENVAVRPDWRNGNGRTLRRRTWPRKRLNLKPNTIPIISSAKPGYAWAQVNHYAIRHPDLMQMRRERGRGSAYVPDDTSAKTYQDYANRHSDSYVSTFNQTVAYDPSILNNVPQTDVEMARLLGDSVLSDLHQQAQAHLRTYLTIPSSI